MTQPSPANPVDEIPEIRQIRTRELQHQHVGERDINRQSPGETHMLRIIQNRSATSAKSYYSHADYYGESQEKAGIWHGQTARLLGLTGTVRQQDFDALCDNRDPRSGEQLTARHNHDRTVGYDFNWHTPKTVSLAYALGDQRIETVFTDAVEETMQEIEREAATRVRTQGQHSNRTTGNLAWASFVHTTTRPDHNGQVDPHLHIHSFVFNSNFDPVEQRFKAVQFRELKRDAPYWEARMHARLAKSLRQLGYSIHRDGRHWDIAGIPEPIKRRFSRRTMEIERIAEEQQITDPEHKSALGAQTRNSKSNHLSFPELQTEWRDRLSPAEAELFENLTNPTGEGSINGPDNVQAAVSNAIRHCFEREAIVPERQLLTQALRFGVGTLDVSEVAAAVNEQGVLTRDIAGRRLSTTREVLEDEARVLQFARDGKHSVTPLNSHWTPAESWLSGEQINAIRTLVSSDDRLQMILGGAGTGKTTLMQQAVKAIEAGGHRVFTFAPSAEASRKVLRDEGFDTATTVAELLVNTELQQKTTGAVLWIDEASLLGSRQLRKVIDLAEQNQARIILSGDWNQHSSVDRGGSMRIIDRYTPVSPIQIRTIRRQQGAYKNAIAAMAQGDVLKGFDQLDQLGWVHELNDDTRYTQLATDYADVLAKKQSALVVSPTHREADLVVSAIRNELQHRKLIDDQEHTVNVLQPRHLTAGQRGDPAWLHPGDVLIFHQNAKGIRKGTRIIVDERLPAAVTAQASRYSVYRPEKLALARGDRIRITSGGKTLADQHQGHKTHRLNTGAVFEVKDIDGDGNITLTNGWTIDKDFGHIAQGWCTTSHSSQGRTVDHVFLAQGDISEAAAESRQFYVSSSRGRRSARLYVDSKTQVRDAIAQSRPETAASDIFSPVTQIERHRRQHAAATNDHTPARTNTQELIHAR